MDIVFGVVVFFIVMSGAFGIIGLRSDEAKNTDAVMFKLGVSSLSLSSVSIIVELCLIMASLNK